ncbi:hypothetical protein [Nocardia sp. NPDC051750]|uniref:hypothetical protein n=1 Tax=Nocardia sp. NPDC051750 TaxID=3364325 RepID=UPI00379EDDCD
MTGTDYRQPEGIAEFADELRLLAEALLERVEPVLRAAAADGAPEWSNCTWCPLCAAAALVRGEQHEVLAAVAAHGTAIVTVLREALAGAPVDPVVSHDHGTGTPAAPDDSPGAGRDPSSGSAGADTADTGTDGPAAESGPAEPVGSDRPDSRRASSGKSRYVGIPVNIKP